MNVIIIGTGNIARVLGKRLYNAGHDIVQVYGRQETAARTLSEELNASFCNDWSSIKPGADIYLLAISDSALFELHQHFQLKNELVIHLAGSVKMDVLRNISTNYGVCWPIQSISSNKKEIPLIPFMLDGSNEQSREKILEMAMSISDSVSIGNDEQRLKMHLAAIIANNFVNHLYTLTESFCSGNNLDFKQLLPIIQETVSRLENYSPSLLQTGPAIRDDLATIQKHLELLAGRADLKQLYISMTDSIQQFYKK